MAMIERDVPLDACTVVRDRPIAGIVLHHTATTALPSPRRGSSWHYCIDRDGQTYQDVWGGYAAHHVGQSDRWRPPWVEVAPWGVQPLSDVNYCTLGIEIVYAPQQPMSETPTEAQHASLKTLLEDLYTVYGALPIVGHGELDSSRWPTEPHLLDWEAAGITPERSMYGRILLDSSPELAGLHEALERCNNIKAEFEHWVRSHEGKRPRVPVGLANRLIEKALR